MLKCGTKIIHHYYGCGIIVDYCDFIGGIEYIVEFDKIVHDEHDESINDLHSCCGRVSSRRGRYFYDIKSESSAQCALRHNCDHVSCLQRELDMYEQFNEMMNESR